MNEYKNLVEFADFNTTLVLFKHFEYRVKKYLEKHFNTTLVLFKQSQKKQEEQEQKDFNTTLVLFKLKSQ